jgi:hypothetical protein
MRWTGGGGVRRGGDVRCRALGVVVVRVVVVSPFDRGIIPLKNRTPVTTLVVTYRRFCLLSLAIYFESSERKKGEGDRKGKVQKFYLRLHCLKNVK